MSWKDVDPFFRNVAEKVCTPEQLEALVLWEDGLGYGRISLHLRISQSSVRGRIRRALLAIELASERAA